MRGQEEIIIKPQRGKGEPELPATGIFCLNPGDAAYLLGKVKAGGARQYFLFNSNLSVLAAGKEEQGLFVAGPAVGAPMAAMTLEKLIALGCQRVLVWGWCGSLVPGLQVGDLLLPTGGFSEEGTSPHYPASGAYTSSPAWQNPLLDKLAAEGLAYQVGKVWSTDAPYRETRAKVDYYAAKGALAVEMEYTALASVATFREIDLGVLLIVSDELSGPKWRPGFQSREFKEKSRLVLDELMAWLRDINWKG